MPNPRLIQILLWLSVGGAAITSFGQIVDDRHLPNQEPTEAYTQLFSTVTWKGAPANEAPIGFLFEPRPLSPATQYPLVVWLHGGGLPEYEFTEHFGPLLWTPMLVIQDLEHLEKYPFYLLVPKCPRSAASWRGTSSNSTSGKEMIEVVADLIEETIRTKPIDPQRVSLVGISSGASAGWELGMRRPELFAAITPIAGGCPNYQRIGLLKNVPIWTFANDQHERDKAAATNSIAALVEAGGRGAATLFHRDGHDAWSGAFEGEPRLLSWLTIKSKSDSVWRYPPGYSVSVWSQYVQWTILGGLFVIGIGSVFALKSHFNRRKSMASIEPQADSLGRDSAAASPKRPVVSLKVLLGAAVLYGVGVGLYKLIVWWSAVSISVVK